MDNQIYFKHTNIYEWDQDQVEREVNYIYSDEGMEVLSMTITPIRGIMDSRITIPIGYDICYTYRIKEKE